MSSLYASGLAGIKAATASLYAHASNVGNAFNPGATALAAVGASVEPTSDSVNLSQEVVGMNQARVQLGASVAVIRTGERMQKALLDMFA